MSPQALRDLLHDKVDAAMAPVARRLVRLGLLPNHITTFGLVLNIAAAALVIYDALLLAGLLWLIAGGFDLLDGAMARTQKLPSAFGAFLDSTFDRVSEGLLFAAIIFRFAQMGEALNACFTAIALSGSFLISYTRARAETLGVACKVGLFTRAERVVLLGLGLGLGFVREVIYVLAVMAIITAAQRIRHTRAQLLSTEDSP
jgi:phosphatidylglycerophosphate synthase